jgi:hypothetical protein
LFYFDAADGLDLMEERSTMMTMDFCGKLPFFHAIIMTDFPVSTAPISSKLSLPVGAYFFKAISLCPAQFRLKRMK